MTPAEITLLFKEAYDSSPPIEGKPTDDDLLSIKETILPLLMVIPYDQLGGVHSLTAILTDTARYATDHGGTNFCRPARLPLYDARIANDATTVIRVKARKRPITLSARTSPVTSRLKGALPNSSAMPSRRFSITTSRTPRRFTLKSRRGRSCHSSKLTAGGCMQWTWLVSGPTCTSIMPRPTASPNSST